jgi:DNA repair protein RadC
MLKEHTTMESSPSPTYTPMIRDLPVDLRPRERMLYAGASSRCTTPNLLAIILRVGVQGQNAVRLGEQLLTDFGGLAGIAQASFEELCAKRGIGEAKPRRSRPRWNWAPLGSVTRRRVPQVRSPGCGQPAHDGDEPAGAGASARRAARHQKQRAARGHGLHRQPQHAVVRVGEVFREAIRANCASMIVVHNHPSGDPTPSPEDVRVTEMLVEAGKLLDVAVLDHVVIGRNRYVSLKERKLAFK